MNETHIREEIACRFETACMMIGGELEFEGAVIDLLHRIHRLCGLVVSEEAADPAMDALLGTLFPDAVAKGGWRHAMAVEQDILATETDLGTFIMHLQMYAEYGIVGIECSGPEQRRALLQEWMDRAELLLDFLPAKAWGLVGADIVRMMRHALARWKLDTDEPVTAEELSMLSGKALQTIRNKLAGKYREIVGNQSRIEAKEALKWLNLQEGFLSSIWLLQEDDTDTEWGSIKTLDAVMFVPVAADGTVFHPGLKKDGGYHIGGPGIETSVDDYGTALEQLQKQPQPHWRRPTPGGIWRRVRGVRWERFTDGELAAEMNKKPPETSFDE